MTEVLPHDDLGRSWRTVLASDAVVHLDAAGAAAPSRAVLDAQVHHLRREAEIGGYAAAAEAQPAVDRAHARLGALLGLDGGSVAIVPNATVAFQMLLAGWPLRAGSKVGVLPSEYTSNRMALTMLGARRDWDQVVLPVDPDGRLEPEGLERMLGTGLDLVTFPVVASQRGIVQPARPAVERCRAAGVPIVLDVAQAAGQVALDGVSADAWVGTSRKWLRGPRGLGFLAGRPDVLGRLDPEFLTIASATWEPSGPVPRAGAARFEDYERSYAAVVGLDVALGELLDARPARVFERIAALGRAFRERLDGVAGWRVVEPLDEDSALVTLAHEHADPAGTKARLAERGIAVSFIPAEWAPGDLDGPRLRVSPHAYSARSDLEVLTDELVELSR